MFITFICLIFWQVLDNEVVLVRMKEKEGYDALQIGAINHPKAHKVCT